VRGRCVCFSCSCCGDRSLQEGGGADTGGNRSPEGAAGRHPSCIWSGPRGWCWKVLRGSASSLQPYSLTRGHCPRRREARPRDAGQDKGSIYPGKELETRKGPKAAKAARPIWDTPDFEQWVLSRGQDGAGLRAACLPQDMRWDAWRWDTSGTCRSNCLCFP